MITWPIFQLLYTAIVVLQPYQVDNNTIYVELGNAIFDSSSLTSGDNGFSLSYENGGHSGSVAVSEVSVLSTDDSILKLTLSEMIYNTDDLTLTYTGDKVKVKYNSNDFELTTENKSVKTNLLEAINYDFSDVSQLTDWKLTYTEVAYESLATDENFCVKSDNDNDYMYINCSETTAATFGSGRPAIVVCNKLFDGAQGDYTLSFRYKVISKAATWPNSGDLSCTVAPSPYAFADISWKDTKYFLCTNMDWTEVSEPFTSKKSAEDLKLFFRSGVWRGEIAIDDVKLSNAETRP